MSYTSNVGGKLIVKAKGDIKTYAKEDIVFNAGKTISFKGDEKGVSFGKPETLKNDNENFDISFSLNKNSKSLVPLGILDFENKFENSFFNFDYLLRVTNLDSLNFEVFDEDGNTIYQINNLAPIVVTAQKLPLLFNKLKEETPPFDPLKPIKTFDIQAIINDFLYPDLTHTGSYAILWDGFDNNNVYDSTRFNGKKLKAKITAKKGGTTKTKEVEFETKYNEVDWVDVKIDKNRKRVDVTLRVDLKDGGSEGISCQTYNSGNEFSSEGFSSNQEDPFKNVNVTICDWDKIPKNVIQPKKAIIKSLTRSFLSLEQLALDGLKYHWGRNSNHAVAKNVTIGVEIYEVFIEPINTTKNAMDDVSLIFNTNNKWMRSGNPGSVTWNPVSWFGNLISGSRIAYNIGYLNNADWYQIFKSDWYYAEEVSFKVDDEFSYTSAHEIGHQILQYYGGTNHSYRHDGSSTIFQNTIPISKGGKSYQIEKKEGEINLMHYFEDDVWQGKKDFPLIVAAEKDVLSLLWLTKINIK